MYSIRNAAVAGSFYSGDAYRLQQDVDTLLQENRLNISLSPKALIVPHAGYQYSGSTAAAAYSLLKQIERPQRVVLIGPCHRVYIHGLAIPSSDAFATPLGKLPLDQETLIELARFPQVQVVDIAHQQEHSLEVQLPFIQRTLGEVPLVPIVFGDCSHEEVEQVLEYLWQLPGTFILVSSDLSHFHDYRTANYLDLQTTHFIESRQYDRIDSHMACGSTAIGGILRLAQKQGLSVKTLKQCNSGDTAGDKSRVVGYAAYALY